MTTLAVDALPVEVQSQFIKQAYKKAEFYGDMFTLCFEFGLRNSEARELQVKHVNWSKCQLELTDSKQVRSHITKQGNKILNESWMIEGRKWLRSRVDDPNISLIVRLAHDVKGLANLADEYDCLPEFTTAHQNHIKANIEQAQQAAAKTAPKGRTVDFSRNPKAKAILKKRCDKYENLGGYLFPSCELSSNRATEFAPVSRQAVYRVIKGIRGVLEATSNKCKQALKSIRTGLHSFRKAAVQKVANTIDLTAASLWIGHGDISVTTRYLDRSEKRMNEINERLAAME